MNYWMVTILGCQLRMKEIRPLIEKVVDSHPDGSFTVEGIIAKFYTGEWSCWIIAEDQTSPIKALFATHGFLDMKGRSNVKVVFMAGEDRETWWHLWDNWVEMARNSGVRRIEIVGRRGLLRTMRGFNKEFVVMTMDLEPPNEIHPNVSDVGRA